MMIEETFYWQLCLKDYITPGEWAAQITLEKSSIRKWTMEKKDNRAPQGQDTNVRPISERMKMSNRGRKQARNVFSE